MGDRYTFPHGVKKLDLGEAVLIFRDDKLVFQPKDRIEHLTLHLGPNSKIIDVHYTQRASGGHETHATQFAIPHDRLVPLFEGISEELTQAIRSLLRPLRIGWMARHRIGAEPAFFPPESEFEEITTVRKQRLYIDESKFRDRMGKLEYLEDLLDLPDGRGFSIISCKNPRAFKIIGSGFKVTGSKGRPQLLWCSHRQAVRELTGLVKRLMPKFKEAMVKDALVDSDDLSVS